MPSRLNPKVALRLAKQKHHAIRVLLTSIALMILPISFAGASAGEEATSPPLISNDIVILGILMGILAIVFRTNSSAHPFLKRFYKIFPALLLCYFLPSLLSLFNVVDPETSQLSYVTKRCLLPTSLVLLTLCTDLRAVFRLGPKALIMFLTGTVGGGNRRSDLHSCCLFIRP